MAAGIPNTRFVALVGRNNLFHSSRTGSNHSAAYVMKVEKSLIDYKGHLNMAYYKVLFDRCVDEAYELLGVGLEYLKTAQHSTFTAEAHVRYLRELREGEPVRATFQLLDYDTKRIHYFQQLFHATDGWMSATSENMTLHVN